MFASIKNYLAGTQQEFKLIKWPTWQETRNLTMVVVGMSILLAVFLGVFDYLFTAGLGLLIN